MFKAFIDDANGADRPSIPAPLPGGSDDFDTVRLMMFGSAAIIHATIHNLHARGFADVAEWSPLAAAGRGEMMSMLTKRLNGGGRSKARGRVESGELKLSWLAIVFVRRTLLSLGNKDTQLSTLSFPLSTLN